MLLHCVSRVFLQVACSAFLYSAFSFLDCSTRSYFVITIVIYERSMLMQARIEKLEEKLAAANMP
jgi:hypothetical protein